MLILEAVRQARRTFRTHRVWTLLTICGVVWGTAAVIFLRGWGTGFQLMLDEGLSKTGKNLVYALPGWIGGEFSPASHRRRLRMTSRDLERIRATARIPDLVVGESRAWAVASHDQTSMTVDLRGVEAAGFEIRRVRVAQGSPITGADLRSRRPVAVLGNDVRTWLLGPHGRVGDWIRLNGRPFEVIGFLEPVGFEIARDRTQIDAQIWIPLTSFQAGFAPQISSSGYPVDLILFRLRDRNQYDAARTEMRTLLAERLRVSPDDPEAIIFVSALEVLLKLPFEEGMGYLTVLAIATLMIGGLGLMNMMLVSVQERRREIGVRLAVGARRSQVVVQFLVETLSLSALGGGLGIGLGVASCLALRPFEVPNLIPLPVLEARVILIAASVMLVVGLAAGVGPAWRAARVDPVVTLRSD